MKKFLASLLAVSLIASMSAVSFASHVSDYEIDGKYDKTSPEKAFEDQLGKDNKYDKDDGYPLDTTIIGPFGYDDDDKNLTTDYVEFGKTAYFLLTNLEPDGTGSDPGTEKKLVTNSDTASNIKIKVDWEEGEDLEKGMTIVKRKVQSVGVYKHIDADHEDQFVRDGDLASDLASNYGFVEDANKYYYMLSVKIGDSSSTSDADLIGTLTLSKSKKPKADDHEYNIAINVDWENSYRRENKDGEKEFNNVSDDIGPLLAETYYSVKFDGDDEIEIEFEDESTFNVDISGQGKVLIYYDTDFNSKIAAKYPLAELNFWNGNGAKFNRTGEFFLRVGDDAEDYAQFLYQVNADGTLSEVPGAEYDEGDGGFYFKTRTLGTYVYSDMELEVKSNSSSGNDDVVVTPDPVAPVTPVAPINPGTGAKA